MPEQIILIAFIIAVIFSAVHLTDAVNLRPPDNN